MRSTLFYIPHEIGGIPLFGMGLLLGLLVLGMVGWIAWSVWRRKSSQELVAALPVWAMAVVIIAFVLPAVEQTWPDGTPIGLPIRGYGMMVLTGLLAGIGITVYRGLQLRIAPDTIIGLGFWMMLGGVIGARAFYVIQKWSSFEGGGLASRLINIVKLTEGGLVIYGGVIGGLVAGTFFCWKHRMHILATADLIAPGFLLGLAFGRIGCLLHGCCYGGVCTVDLPSITFPPGSAAYVSQASDGRLLGIELGENGRSRPVTGVAAGSAAAEKGVQPGDRLRSIRLRQFPANADAPIRPNATAQLVDDGRDAPGKPQEKNRVSPKDSRDPIPPPELVADVELSNRSLSFWPGELPARSLPVHPTQVYAAVNALLLSLVIWHLQPLSRHDGIAFMAAILMYACSRFLLEWIRSDEAGQLGTQLTISQLVSLGAGGLAIIAIMVVSRWSPGRAFPWPSRV